MPLTCARRVRFGVFDGGEVGARYNVDLELGRSAPEIALRFSKRDRLAVTSQLNAGRPDGVAARSRPDGRGHDPFVLSWGSFSCMKARISSDMSRSFSHCSLYKVTGKRPNP